MPRAACQPAAQLGDSPARGLGLERSFQALKGFSFPVGMSQRWVPHRHRAGRAAWHGRRAVSQPAGRLFFFLLLHSLGQLDESFIQNSSFKELVLADGKSNINVTLLISSVARTPAAGRAVPKHTQLSPPEHSSVTDRLRASDLHLLS